MLPEFKTKQNETKNLQCLKVKYSPPRGCRSPFFLFPFWCASEPEPQAYNTWNLTPSSTPGWGILFWSCPTLILQNTTGWPRRQAGVCSPHARHSWTSRYPRFVLMVANSLLAKQARRPHPMSFSEDRADGRHYLRGKCFPQTQSPQIMACRLDGVCSLILYSAHKLWMAFIKTMNGFCFFFF